MGRENRPQGEPPAPHPLRPPRGAAHLSPGRLRAGQGRSRVHPAPPPARHPESGLFPDPAGPAGGRAADGSDRQWEEHLKGHPLCPAAGLTGGRLAHSPLSRRPLPPSPQWWPEFLEGKAAASSEPSPASCSHQTTIGLPVRLGGRPLRPSPSLRPRGARLSLPLRPGLPS